jgi:hypothetical protein
MSKEKSKLEMYARLILRIIASTGIGLLASIIFFWFFLFWCLTFIPIVSLQSQWIIFIFTDLAFFFGTYLGGYLSLTLKRSIITTTCSAIVLGIFLIFLNGLIGIIGIIFIICGGLLGGGLLKYLKK